MNQADLYRAVARATGETVSTVKRIGFLLEEPGRASDPESEEHGPRVIDWDELDRQRCEPPRASSSSSNRPADSSLRSTGHQVD